MPLLPLLVAAAAPQAVEYRDPETHRRVPVWLYNAQPTRPRPLAILLPGHGIAANRYSLLARVLAKRGYTVAAVQYEMKGDPPMPSGGTDLGQRRMPFWIETARTVDFVVAELRTRGLASRGTPITLVGHSNGGDVAMLYASQSPRDVRLVFTLDNRRMPIPRTDAIRLCTARSADQPADPGVLPDPEETRDARIFITQTHVKHDDMFDGASAAQRTEMAAALETCLSGKW